MEIIIGLIVIGFAAALFFNFRKKDEPLVVSAPYKVEDTPAPAPVAEPEAVVETPVVETAPAKAPRKPRAPKAEAVVEKKPVARKPAAKKPAAKKPAARSVTKSKKA